MARNNLPLVTYTLGNDLSCTLQGAGGIGGLLARTDNAQMIVGNPTATAYYFSDASGNVTSLVYTNGMIAARYNYDPFGRTLAMGRPIAPVNKRRFSSKLFADTCGLYSYGYRFYDPNSQRWLSRDLIGELGGLNLYGYVGNNPIMFYDSYGLWSWAGVGAGVGGFVGGVAAAGISIVLDAGTLGINIAGTPAEIGEE